MGNDAVCCPEFKPEKWDGKRFVWDNKRFIKGEIPTFFHIPFPPMMNKVMGRMCKLAEDSKLVDADKADTLVLFADPTPFRSEIFLSVTGEVPGAENVVLSGTYEAKVFDGPYNAVPKFIKEMDAYLNGKNLKAKRYLVHFAYCPKCLKKFGRNSMIVFAEV